MTFHPDSNLPDCMMPDGGDCCVGYQALLADWRRLHAVAATPQEWHRELIDREPDHGQYTERVTTPLVLTPQDAWDELVNKDDRTSPEEYQDHCLISFEELQDFMSRSYDTFAGYVAPSLHGPVSYRWRKPGNKHWIYDPTPEWIEDHKHEIELEPLFTGVAQPAQDEMENYRLALAWIKGQATDPQAKEIAATALDSFTHTRPQRETPTASSPAGSALSQRLPE